MPFLPLVWTFVRANWKIIIIGLVAASIFGYIGILKHQVKSRDKEIVSLNAQLTASNILNETYLESINRSNLAIRAMQAKAQSQKQMGVIALKKANEANVGLSQKAKFYESLLNLPEAKNKGCGDALKAFRDGH